MILPHRGIVFIETGHQYGIPAPLEPREIYHTLIKSFKKKMIFIPPLEQNYGAPMEPLTTMIMLNYKHGAPPELNSMILWNFKF